MGSLVVNTRNETSRNLNAIGTALPAVIISHGKNGAGAYMPTGTLLPLPAGADENANATHNNNSTTFVSRLQTPAVSSCDDATATFCEFDDMVVMISSNVLMARMIAAGKLP